MTCKEKLQAEKPECINPGQPGGCFGCPHMYGYLKKPRYCDDRFILGPVICDVCWSRELPEDGSGTE